MADISKASLLARFKDELPKSDVLTSFRPCCMNG